MMAEVEEEEEKLAERVSAAPEGVAAALDGVAPSAQAPNPALALEAPAPLADDTESPPSAPGRRAYRYADPGTASIAAGADGR